MLIERVNLWETTRTKFCQSATTSKIALWCNLVKWSALVDAYELYGLLLFLSCDVVLI